MIRLSLLIALLLPVLALADNQQKLAAVEKAMRSGDTKKSVKLLTEIIEHKSEKVPPIAYYLRGRENFRLANIEASLKDFDQLIKLAPQNNPRLWERGITYYYAGKFKEGAKQFALYQTYHSEDVENAAFHFICVAQTEGIKKARAGLLPIRTDRRIPMMKVHELYAGKAAPDEVMELANNAPPQFKDEALFYAHLYLGLYFEANKQAEKSAKHMTLAANAKVGGYMRDVARVHVKIRKAEANQAKSKQ